MKYRLRCTEVGRGEKKKKKLTPANLCYSSRHKRDNYWCGGRRTERRTKSDSRGESRGRCVNFGVTAEHAVTLVIDKQKKKQRKTTQGKRDKCKAASIVGHVPAKGAQKITLTSRCAAMLWVS